MTTQHIIEKLGISIGVCLLYFLCLIVYLYQSTVLIASCKPGQVHSFLQLMWVVRCVLPVQGYIPALTNESIKLAVCLVTSATPLQGHSAFMASWVIVLGEQYVCGILTFATNVERRQHC